MRVYMGGGSTVGLQGTNISMSFNSAVSITTSIFCRMMRGWSCLMDRNVVKYFSVPCWRTGQNCVKSESG